MNALDYFWCQQCTIFSQAPTHAELVFNGLILPCFHQSSIFRADFLYLLQKYF